MSIGRKTSEENIAEIQSLYNRGSNVADISRITGIPHSTVYGYTRVIKRGFGSLHEYQEHLAKERTERSQNKELSDLIKSRLEYLSKNQLWLSKKAKVSKKSVSNYSQGKSIPKEQTLLRILKALEVFPENLEYLIED